MIRNTLPFTSSLLRLNRSNLTHHNTFLLKSTFITTTKLNKVDPTPDKKRGGPDREATAGDVDGGSKQITQSDAAFDPNSTRPQESAKEIENETNKDMSRSAASKMPSDLSTKKGKEEK